jgi:hypothetical protein
MKASQATVPPEASTTAPNDRLSDVGAKTLEMYQTQVGLANGAWIVLVLLSVATVGTAIGLRLLAECHVVKIPLSVWAAPLVLYEAFVGGNLGLLGLRLEELRLLRGVAMSEAGLPFQAIEPASSKRTYIVVQYVVVLVYAVLWFGRV